MLGTRIQPIDHRILANAEQVHAVQMSAYAQEAQLLGAIYFPPLARSVEDLRASTEEFLAALLGDEVIGAASVLPDEENMGMCIGSLVVAPRFQRHGIGSALMAAILKAHQHLGLTVQTGVKNAPALALYRQLEFLEVRRWLVGREPLELVKLRRGPNGSAL